MSAVMRFVGVSTGGSSAMRLFPLWAEALGLHGARLIGTDLPLDAGIAAYRDAVRAIRDDPAVRGALVTTHKVGLYQAAGDLFDELDRFATACREVSCIAKRDGKLVGSAKDPVTAGRALAELLDPGHFARTRGHVLCLGAGGAGTAILVHLLTLADPAGRPAAVVVTDVRPERVEAMTGLLERLDPGPTHVRVDHAPDQAANDAHLAALPPGSLVVNATGLGKDQPGSPLSGTVAFPEGGVAWELNYRGELDFLAQARAQAERRGLTVADGWSYFLHGWSEHIAEVFDLDLTAERMASLRAIAETARR